MICQTIFKKNGREWIIFGQDPQKPGNLADTNQVLVTDGTDAILLDPGSIEVFPAFIAEISKKFSVDGINQIFFSHQDPDAVSSLPLWQRVIKGDLTISVSELWVNSISHLDASVNIAGIPDNGKEISLGSGPKLQAVPAHYLYSPGNFHLYDRVGKALFSGKVGATESTTVRYNSFIVKDFARHIELMREHHQRWMPSQNARDSWLQNISVLEIDALVPQRGPLFVGKDVDRFLDWFSSLQLASADQVFCQGEAVPKASAPSIQQKRDAIKPKSKGIIDGQSRSPGTFDTSNKSFDTKYNFLECQPEPNNRYRLVTRSDFDGLVCALLLEALDVIDDIFFAHPNDMQHGRIEITDTDIITNLPYVRGCHLTFDHHSSETSRIEKPQPNHIIDPEAPSAARVLFNYYGGKERFHSIPDGIMEAVDKCDMAQFTMKEILYADGWPLINFLMDARTGLGRFHGFRVPNYELMMNFPQWFRDYSVDKILELPDVKQRVQLYREHEPMFKDQIERCAEVHGNLVLLNYLEEESIYVGNRFMVYAIFPQCNISISQMWGEDRRKVIFACGKSIFDRSSRTNIGELMLQFGGGGHSAAGTCQAELGMSDTVRHALIAKIKADG